MFRPQIQKTSTLFFIALFNVFMVYMAVNSSTKVEQSGIEDRIAATKKMHIILEEMKKEFSNKQENDIYKSGVLGVKNSSITSISKKSMLLSKQITTHPNFAALIIALFQEAELSQGDTIAVSMTGSFPGANIALHSACLTMDITPIIMTSIGSSSWGANIETFSWPVMEDYLLREELIQSKSVAYSIGGQNDIGEQIDSLGIDMIVSIAHDATNDGIIFINEPVLEGNISEKVKLFRKQSNNYSAYINIGGGAASMGAGIDKDTMKVGLINPVDLEYMELMSVDIDTLDSDNFKTFKKSIAYTFIHPDGNHDPIPIINIKNIKKLTNNLFASNEEIQIYEGTLFYKYYRYNPFVILLGLFLTLSLIIAVGLYSHLQIKKRMESNEIDPII